MRAITLAASVAAISAMGLFACMGTENDSKPSQGVSPLDDTRISHALGLAKASAEAVGQAELSKAATQSEITASLEQSKAIMREAGVCEGMIGAVDDLVRLFDDLQTVENIDPSYSAYPDLLNLIQCSSDFVSGSVDDETEQLASSLADYEQLSDCICGGSGSLFGDYNTSWRGFSPVTGSSRGYSGSNGETTGSGFRTGGNATGTGYQGSLR